MNYDIVIVGAGPAGMAAATEAAGVGAAVLLLDDQATPGGQIYRAIEAISERRGAILGKDYVSGRGLVETFRKSGGDYVSGATVWQVTDQREVGYSANGKARLVRAPFILIATGAMERPFPVPGWTLPGVMMAGAAQTMLKTSGIAAEDAVFAGSGPLLYLVAYQYLKAGVRIAALLDTTPRSNRLAAMTHLPGALRRLDLLSKGRRWLSEIKASGIPIIDQVTGLEISGNGAVDAVTYKTHAGGSGAFKTSHVLLHQGVVPNVNLSMASGIDHIWNDRQLCWQPKTDSWARTNIEGLLVAGDGGGIGGALAAEASGRIAALGAMEAIGKIDEKKRNANVASARHVLKQEQQFRPFIDTWFRPSDHFRVPENDKTIVCRCEELTLGDLKEVITIGLAGPNQLKSFCRAGMGPCQGRFCGLTVQELIARQTGRHASDVGYYRLRPPIKPLTLNELADLEADAPGNEN